MPQLQSTGVTNIINVASFDLATPVSHVIEQGTIINLINYTFSCHIEKIIGSLICNKNNLYLQRYENVALGQFLSIDKLNCGLINN